MNQNQNHSTIYCDIFIAMIQIFKRGCLTKSFQFCSILIISAIQSCNFIIFWYRMGSQQTKTTEVRSAFLKANYSEETIELNDNEIKTQHISAIIKEIWDMPDFPFHTLKELELSGNFIEARGIKTLASCPFQNLQSLNLGDNNLCDEGLRYISDGPFPNLRRANCGQNNVTDIGAKHFANGGLKKLTLINLAGNNLTDEGVKHILMSSFDSLTELGMFCNKTMSETQVLIQSLKLKNRKGQQLVIYL